MTVLVACETLLLVLLLVLVAGLLRSHAEILRRLGPPEADHQVAEPGVRAGQGGAHDIAGTTLTGDALMIGLEGDSPPTLLAFLSTGCAVCEQLWGDLRAGRPSGLPASVRLVAVVKDASAESPARLRSLAPATVPVLMSSAAWRDYNVSVTPYFVYLEAGRVHGEGSASAWHQILSLLGDASADAAYRDRGAGDIDTVLAEAGIGPDHPSLYPTSAAQDAEHQ